MGYHDEESIGIFGNNLETFLDIETCFKIKYFLKHLPRIKCGVTDGKSGSNVLGGQGQWG